ncbi:MAG: 50S ribosomal protein L25 [Candidatus Moranbacteria bacterium GW2011_GWF2_34_56]|nr:MAG: 50S ribosomal protein L25 [Candidatus Moranbacteria bacterium GW2011_GWF1_34_10]KKP63852.1 MAG: 50S ribosomal protein L25 [Candidatus Moranbacteria bacterium GW2011_GWF2_34_56]HBI17222.1 50S ribosomal protein L25 [Candidatus Moranbacteria bacterium]
MKSISLKAESRDLETENLNLKRKGGLIPAVLYGQSKENKHVWVNNLEFGKVFEQAGENTVVVLEINGGAKENVIIYDYQMDSLSGKIVHIDLLRVNMKEEIETKIPLNFIGESPAVKENGGTMVKSLDDVAVKCLPGNMPQEFVVDLAKLVTFEDRFTVGDLNVPADVEVLDNLETIIASVSAPRSEEELAELNEKVEEDVTKVEGVEKPKAEGEKSE